MAAAFGATVFAAGLAVALGAAAFVVVLAAGLAAAVFAATGFGAAAFDAALGAAVFAVAGFTALDFGAALGLEAAVAGFGDADLDVDGDLAMYSPTPRFDQKRGDDGQTVRQIATIRHISGV